MTTTSIPLGAFPVAADTKWRRDQWGRYLILPPGGDKPVGYTRATTAAGWLDEGYGIPPWMATMAITGTLLRPGLYAQWEALLARHDGSPWYGGDEAKRECKRLVAEAAAVGGANDRAEQGTALHELTAMVDEGRTLNYISAATEADLSAYTKTLAAAGVTFLPGMIERTVVLDDKRIAGTFDRGAVVPGFDQPLIADLKTGADLSFSWHSIATQLAIYANGRDLYRQGPATDGSEDEREPAPNFDLTNALVIWLPAGSGTCELFLVDIAAGWDALEHGIWVNEWRKRTVAMEHEPGQMDRFRPATPDAELVTVLEASLAVVEAQKAATTAPEAPKPADGDSGAPGANGTKPLVVDYHDDLRAWLQGRIDAIGAKSPEARADLATAWPADMPALRTSTGHSPTDLANIEHLLDQVEKRHRVIFPEPRPGGDDIALVQRMFPNADAVGPDQKETTT
jgi:hypothetical protein